MTETTQPARNEQADNEDGEGGGTTAARFDRRFHVRLALAERGLNVADLTTDVLHVLEEELWERLSPVLLRIADRWKADPRRRLQQEMVDRELRRLFIARREEPVDESAPCEGCGYPKHHPEWFILDFRGLRVCDGCCILAEFLLATLQRPLIEALQAEPTIENARALGFELVHDPDRHLSWHDEEDTGGYAGSYPDEEAALQGLVDELTYDLACGEEM